MDDVNTVAWPNVLIVGAGGVTACLIGQLIKLFKKAETPPLVTIQDADILEERNLDRQLFLPEDVGKAKADALVERYESEYPRGLLKADVSWFVPGSSIPWGTFVFASVDNHAARRAILAEVDERETECIILGNEYWDADAQYYTPKVPSSVLSDPWIWKGTRLDPRVRFPEILTDKTGDPTAPQGCVGLAQERSPQLAAANMAAATCGLWLFLFHVVERPRLRPEAQPYWPVQHTFNINRLITTRVEDLITLPTQK